MFRNRIQSSLKIAVKALKTNKLRTGLAMLRRPYFVTVAAAIWVALGLLFCLFGFLR